MELVVMSCSWPSRPAACTWAAGSGRRRERSVRTVPPGTPGIVQAPLEPTGTVLLGGEPWTARAADERHLERDARVRLVRFDGLTAIVEPAEPLTEPSPPPPAPPADTSA